MIAHVATTNKLNYFYKLTMRGYPWAARDAWLRHRELSI